MTQQHAVATEVEDGDPFASPPVIVLGDAAILTQGGRGSSVEDKRYQYG